MVGKRPTQFNRHFLILLFSLRDQLPPGLDAFRVLG